MVRGIWIFSNTVPPRTQVESHVCVTWATLGSRDIRGHDVGASIKDVITWPVTGAGYDGYMQVAQPDIQAEYDSLGQGYPLAVARHLPKGLPAPGFFGRFNPFAARGDEVPPDVAAPTIERLATDYNVAAATGRMNPRVLPALQGGERAGGQFDAVDFDGLVQRITAQFQGGGFHMAREVKRAAGGGVDIHIECRVRPWRPASAVVGARRPGDVRSRRCPPTSEWRWPACGGRTAETLPDRSAAPPTVAAHASASRCS